MMIDEHSAPNIGSATLILVKLHNLHEIMEMA